MRSPADAAIERAETSVRSLGLLFEPELLLDALETTAWRGRWTKLDASYFRYKPHTRALAAFRAESAGPAELIYAIAHGADAIDKTDVFSRVASPGPSVVHLRDRGVSVFRFPADRRLRSLARLLAPDTRASLLHRVFGAGYRGSETGAITTLAYKPERRFVGRSEGGQSAVLKFFTASGFQSARSRYRALEKSALPDAPRIVGSSKKHRVLALEWVEGELLRDHLRRPAPLPFTALETTGARLAELHAGAVALSELGESASFADCGVSAQTLAFLLPPEAARVRRVHRRILEFASSGNPRPVFCHGDFYAKQVLIGAAGNAHFLDFDRAGWGDASIDLATFWAHLERDRISGRIDADPETVLDLVASGYEKAAALDRRRLSGAAARSLFSIAMHPFRSREVDWSSKTALLLRRCEELLDDAARVGVGSGGERTRFLDAALHPTEGPAAIAKGLGSAIGCVGPGVLVRHKNGRRALVRYPPVGCDGAVLGKLRPKGPDREAYRVHRALFERGFRPDCDRSFFVPQPLGMVPSLGMWLQAECPGVPARTLLFGREGPMLAGRIAEALWALHSCSVEPTRGHGLGHEVDALVTRLERVARSRPELATRLHVLTRCYQVLATEFRSCPRPIGIHRDFYFDQVLVDGDRIVLLDFDLFALGDPALDVGNFIAHLEEYALRSRGNHRAFDATTDSFRRRYLACCGQPETAHRIEIYRILSLARHIELSTRFRDREHETASLLELCEAATKNLLGSTSTERAG